MISGFDRYFQIVKCFRDEDLRADRQPEFTQIDIEMALIEQDDIINTCEKLVQHIFKETLNKNIKIPFPRITYEEAMKKYKKDSPDLRKNTKDPEELAFCWVIDFPLFEYSKEEKRFKAVHHPFTSPQNPKDLESKEKTAKAKAKAYDLVLNGIEIAGGSIRIHDNKTQQKIFEILGISKKEAEEKFSFLLEALQYGAPPHGGIAFGLDRLVKIMTKAQSIREIIAFPKNKAAQDLLTGAPSKVTKEQLNELGLALKRKK